MRKGCKVPASTLFFVVSASAVVGCGSRALTEGLAVGSEVGPVQLATVGADESLSDITVDASGVYFSVAWYPDPLPGGPPGSDTAGAIRRVAREGGGTVELWRGQGAAYAVATGTAAIYFVTYEYRSAGRDGDVRSVPRTGGPARTLGIWSSHGSSIGLAVDGDTVYWGHSAGSGGALNRTDGLDETTTALIPEVSSPVGLATDGDRVFFVSGGVASTQGVFGVPATGGAPATLLDRAGTTTGSLAVSRPSQRVIASVADAGVVAIDLSSTSVTTLTDAPAGDVATDDAFAYWVDVAGGRIAKAPITGGAATTVASGLSRSVAIAVDDRFVYWADRDARRVMRAPK